MNASHMVNSTSLRPALSAQAQTATTSASCRQTNAAASTRRDISPPLTIESVAFAGIDMPVHLVVTRQGHPTASSGRSLMVLDYPAFSRLLREKAPRLATIAVLAALGAKPTVDKASGFRNWVQIHIHDVIGAALALSGTPAAQSQPNQPIAA
ncbi:MAG: hypothetical protein L7S67_08575 [Flavobacteriales bacterium]|nr:hypothetical protein [Flavobacteriales bacterium]